MNDSPARRTPSGTDLEGSAPEQVDVNGSVESSGARRLTPVEGEPMVSPAVATSLPVSIQHADESVPPYVRRAQAGDTRAFGELYQLHRRDVARLASRLLGPRGGDLEDVIQ